MEDWRYDFINYMFPDGDVEFREDMEVLINIILDNMEASDVERVVFWELTKYVNRKYSDTRIISIIHQSLNEDYDVKITKKGVEKIINRFKKVFNTSTNKKMFLTKPDIRISITKHGSTDPNLKSEDITFSTNSYESDKVKKLAKKLIDKNMILETSIEDLKISNEIKDILKENNITKVSWFNNFELPDYIRINGMTKEFMDAIIRDLKELGFTIESFDKPIWKASEVNSNNIELSSRKVKRLILER